LAFIELRGVSKSFGSGAGRTEVLRDVELSIDEGELVAIVGFSGSGKTTLISILAGLLAPDTGTVRVEGHPVRGAGPDRALVFQSYALFPWLTVTENVALAVDAVFPDWPRARRRAHVEEHVALVGLAQATRKRPGELSGGMRQRVAVARALAMNPRILLLDEPLGALDALTRATLQQEIARIWMMSRKTVVLITNDVEEGILLADRVIPLDPGPPATLGPAFTIDLPRPRDRSALNHDPTFKALRTQILGHLIEARRRATAQRGGPAPTIEWADDEAVPAASAKKAVRR
jgi:nitrate/nitrite transport system ATP-binding protein